MRTTALIFGLFLTLNTLGAQQRINGAFAFQTDPAKKYALYIPADYNPAVPHKMVLGLHPLNTNRWDAESWCDTLIAFSAANQILLVCPDGGLDGAVNDPVDTAFTSVLLDSVAIWYNIDPDQRYVMGFSWGGLTTYTYGLNHADKFCGFLPIGAAISGADIFVGIAQYASGKPFYLVHGAMDAVNTRYYPALNTLNSWSAKVNSLLMPGIGHTIDFPNRNQILTTAFQWLETENSCIAPSSTSEADQPLNLRVLSNLLSVGEQMTLQVTVPIACDLKYQLMQMDGKTILAGSTSLMAGVNTVLLRVPTVASQGMATLQAQCVYGHVAMPVVIRE